jgi:hypothetical protein
MKGDLRERGDGRVGDTVTEERRCVRHGPFLSPIYSAGDCKPDFKTDKISSIFMVFDKTGPILKTDQFSIKIETSYSNKNDF